MFSGWGQFSSAAGLALEADDVLTGFNNACAYCLFGDLDAAFDLLIDMQRRSALEPDVVEMAR